MLYIRKLREEVFLFRFLRRARNERDIIRCFSGGYAEGICTGVLAPFLQVY